MVKIWKMCELCKGIYVDFQTKSQLFLRVWVLETLNTMSKQLFSYFLGAYGFARKMDLQGFFFEKLPIFGMPVCTFKILK